MTVKAQVARHPGPRTIPIGSPLTGNDRRAFLRMALAWPVGCALLGLLPACEAVSADTPKKIRYGREMCDHCAMLISDERFAAQVWHPEKKRFSLFDDIGCAVSFAEEQGLSANGEARIWAADYDEPKGWIDARTAFYLGGVHTPMDYGYAAVRLAGPDRVPFETMRASALEKALCSPRDRTRGS